MLVRSAFSANIKERRDCSTALFDERGRMIAQAEHIPVHLGAMPDAVAAVARARTRAGRGVDPQRPVRGRHAPPRHHAGLAHARSASRSRARTTPTSARSSRAPAGGLAHARRGGRRDPADAARRRRRSRGSSRACATRTSAAATSARSSPRTASPSCASTSSASGAGADASAAAMDELHAYSERRRPRGARRASRRSLRGGGRARRHPTGELEHPSRRDDRRRRDRDRLRRNRAAARREPQLPARGHALGLLLRRPLPDRPGPPRVRAERSRR